jgi:AAA domain
MEPIVSVRADEERAHITVASLIGSEPSEMITRINHIKGHRIFQDFAWHSDLVDFKRYNLICGWNGSGKSTLSSLFRCPEKREPPDEGDAELIIGGKRWSLSAITKESILPLLRVFNKQFVAANVFVSNTSTTSSLAPIYFLGEDSVEKEASSEDVGMHLLIGSGPGEATVLVFHVTVHGHEHRVDQ